MAQNFPTNENEYFTVFQKCIDFACVSMIFQLDFGTFQ
jgi:hypothetical protein